MVVTIRQLNKDLCKLLEQVVTTGERIVVTKYGSEYVEIRKSVVHTNKVVTPDDDATHIAKQETIAKLRKATQDITRPLAERSMIPGGVITEKELKEHCTELCFACKTFGGKRVPAVEQCLRYEEGLEEHLVWLKKHASKSKREVLV